MADELTTNLRLKLVLESKTIHLPSLDASSEKSIDVAGTERLENVQTVGFAAAEVVLSGDVAVGGYIYLENLDATNYVELIETASSKVALKLIAGDWACFRTGADFLTDHKLQADTADCRVLVLMIDP